MREIRDTEGRGFIEETGIQTDFSVSASQVTTSHDSYFRGDRIAEDVFVERTDGPFSVEIGRDRSDCLRKTTFLRSDSRRAVETYLDLGSGWAILQRVLIHTGNESEPDLSSGDLTGFDCTTCYFISREAG